MLGSGSSLLSEDPDRFVRKAAVEALGPAVHRRDEAVDAINGTDGTLRITADAAQPQIYPLTVAGAQGPNEPAELAVPVALTQRWPALTTLEGAPAYYVGRAYGAFAADIDNGTHTVPDFADAVRRHEVIAAIERSAASGNA